MHPLLIIFLIIVVIAVGIYFLSKPKKTIQPPLTPPVDSRPESIPTPNPWVPGEPKVPLNPPTPNPPASGGSI